MFVFVRFFYIFLCFRTFSYVIIRFNFRYQFEGFYESQKIVGHRKKTQKNVRNCTKRTKHVRIGMIFNNFVRFPTVCYDFLRLFFSVRIYILSYILFRYVNFLGIKQMFPVKIEK